MATGASQLGSNSMLIEEAKIGSGPKELRVKIGVEYHLKLHALKLLRGKRMSEAVEEALSFYFERVRLEHEAATPELADVDLSAE